MSMTTHLFPPPGGRAAVARERVNGRDSELGRMLIKSLVVELVRGRRKFGHVISFIVHMTHLAS